MAAAPPSADESEAIRRLTPRKKALLVGGLRLLRTLGEPWLAELYGPRSSERIRAFLIEVGLLEHLLTGAVLETAAWHVGPRGRLKPRAWEQAVTACLICLLDELKGHPKRGRRRRCSWKRAGFSGEVEGERPRRVCRPARRPGSGRGEGPARPDRQYRLAPERDL